MGVELGSLGLESLRRLQPDVSQGYSHGRLKCYWSMCVCVCVWVAQSCPPLCESMDCRTLGFPVLHHLPGLAQTHVHWVGDAIQWSCPLTAFSSHLQYFPASGSFQMSQFFTSCGQSIGASASASVLPVTIQGWFSKGLTGLISLQSKGLSRVFSNTIVRKYQFFGTQSSL